MHSVADRRGDASGPGSEPTRIGPYRILERIGEGGMGVVYVAEQTEPVRRRVALKLIKLGMDTREVIARFEGERQALALMNHRSIARILDAGTTESGRPFFVMEHVPGMPIDAYCDRERLKPRERLKLFVEVCEAVQHAHQKGVIHRDLKPTNILITEVDGKPAPKVIDFGIAKAIDQRLSEQTLYTELGRVIGTPEYMSPEQAVRGPLDVDTRSDVYSLGVVLYQLLTGVLPFDFPALLQEGYTELLRAVQAVDPPTPSTRLTRLDRELAAPRALARRASDVHALARQLRGELDWIVMKALAKDRSRRYQTASELAADVQRSLDGEPILARPPSVTYRMRKLVARHRVAFGFAVTVALLVAALAVTSTIQAQRIAVEAERARREARTAERVTAFLVDLFRVADPSEARGNTITAREVLDRGAQQIQGDLADDPETLATLLEAIGSVYRNLGLYAESLPLLERCLALREEVFGAEDVQLAGVLHELGQSRRVRGEYVAAEQALQRSIAILEDADEEHEAELASALDGLGSLYADTGRSGEAIELHERALAIQRRIYGPRASELESTLNNLGAACFYVRDLDRASRCFEEALEIWSQKSGDPDPKQAYVLNNLGTLYAELGRFDEAEKSLRSAFELAETGLAPNHEVIGAACEQLTELLLARGAEPDEIRPFAERGVELRSVLYGPDHPAFARSLVLLGRFHARLGEFEEARALFEEALRAREEYFGPGGASVATALTDLAWLDLEEGSPSPATEEALARALEILERSSETEDRIHTLEIYARFLDTASRPAEATAALDRAAVLRAAVASSGAASSADR